MPTETFTVTPLEKLSAFVPTKHCHNPLRWREVGASILISSFVGAWLASRFGLDVNWDLRNYHYYSVYAFLNDRYDTDIAAGQAQTWLNPFADFLNYALIRYLNPYVSTLILGAISGLNVAAIYALSRVAIADHIPIVPARLLACVLAIAALDTPMYWSELGGIFSDANTQLLVLVALVVIWRFDFSDKAIFAGSLLIGLSASFKLTNAVFAIAFVCAVLAFQHRGKLRTLVIALGGLFIGYLPLGASWNIFLWTKFGNPTFPYLNNIFHSLYALPEPFSDNRFKPETLFQAFSLPVTLALKQPFTSEIVFRDVRFLILGALALLFSCLVLAQFKNRRFIFRGDVTLFLGVFFCVVLLFWLKLSGVQRYIIILEMISFLLILAILDCIVQKITVKIITFSVAFVFVLLTTSAPNWGHMPFGREWLQADFPADQKDRKVLHIMLGDDPLAYVIVSAPPDHVFIRLSGNFPLALDTGLGQRAQAQISAFSGEIRSLSLLRPPPETNALLKAYGLELTPGDCEQVKTRMETMQSCLLKKL